MIRILQGDALGRLAELPDESVQCCITSPPYWGLRAYTGDPGMIGLEPTFGEHLENLLAVFREVRRVLRKDGTLWLNYGDAYAGGGKGQGGKGTTSKKQLSNSGSYMGTSRMDLGDWKPKDLMMMPARVAMALQEDGWWLRSEIVWAKPDPMPESVTDRPTTAHEKIFLLAKSRTYFYDHVAVRTKGKGWPHGEPTGWANSERYHDNDPRYPKRDKQAGHSRRHDGFNDRWNNMTKEQQQANGVNLRNVLTISSASFSGAHFATFPPALVETCVKAGTREGDTVLDPFGGAGTVGLVASRLNRDAILIEISEEYCAMARKRINGDQPLFPVVE